jgi:hypothetical protein
MKEQDLQNYTCEDLEGHLSDLLEGHVAQSLRDGLNLHLQGCVDCWSLKESVAAAVLECRMLSGEIEHGPVLEERLIRIAVPDWKTDCSRFEKHLSEFIDGILEVNLEMRMRRHSETCMECGSLSGLVRQGISELRGTVQESRTVRAELTARLATIPETESRVGLMTLFRNRLNEVLEIFEPVFTSPLIGQSAVAVLLIASAGLFFGVPTKAEEHEAPAITQGYKMIIKTYRDGSYAVMNAVSYGKEDSTEGLDR